MRLALLLSFLVLASGAWADVAAVPPPAMGLMIARLDHHPVKCRCLGIHDPSDAVLSDGRRVPVTRDRFGWKPVLADDGVTVAWATSDHQRFPASTGLRNPGGSVVIARLTDGQIVKLRTIEPDMFTHDYRLIEGGRALAVWAGPLHGPGWYTLYDVASGAEKAAWSIKDGDAPDWVLASRPISNLRPLRRRRAHRRSARERAGCGILSHPMTNAL
jgi:hypothetical protein